MDIGPIAPVSPTDKVMAAWAAAVHELTIDPAQGGTSTPTASHDPSLPVSQAPLPGADADFSHEAATVQTGWRAPIAAAETPRTAELQAPELAAAETEFAVPSSLLVPAVLTGLQVEHATIWPLPHPAAPAPTLPTHRAERRDEPPTKQEERSHEQADDEDPSDPPPTEHPPEAPVQVFAADEPAAWVDALNAALRQTQTARLVPQALTVAAEQWRRGRCVVLACPQGLDPAGAAWAFVLWPRPADAAAGDGATRAVFGLRVEARLIWHTLPPTTPWCHARVVKEHHPRHGRQLVAADREADAKLPCDVQLGPVLARSLRWCEVRVHIQSAQRFWAALGAQWSVHVVVSARPLLAARASLQEAPRC